MLMAKTRSFFSFIIQNNWAKEKRHAMMLIAQNRIIGIMVKCLIIRD
jgi:hypothetical protein